MKLEERKLPKGWEVKKFEDLLDYIQPTKHIVSSTEYSDEYETPVLTAGKSFIIGYTNEKNGIFDQLPVIIFDDFTTAHKFVRFPFKVKSSAMKILKPRSPSMNIKFIFYYMQTVRITFDTHKRYWISVYSKISIPTPPPLEQQAIVTKIEELFSQLENGKQQLLEAQAKLKTYRQSLLKNAFEGKMSEKWRKGQKKLYTADDLLKKIYIEKEKEAKLTNKKPKPINSLSPEDIKNLPPLPPSWKWVSLGEIISDLTDYHANGSYVKMKENVQLLDSPEYAIMIRATNFEKNNFRTNLKYITENAYNFLSRSKLFGDEILIGKIGNAGKVYLMPHLKRPASLAMNLFALRFNLDVSKYIYYHLLSSFSKQQISDCIKGVGNPTIDKNSIRSLAIALPSYEEQQTITSEIERKITICDKIEETIRIALKQSEVLRQSVLKKAFEGQLVAPKTEESLGSTANQKIKK